MRVLARVQPVAAGAPNLIMPQSGLVYQYGRGNTPLTIEMSSGGAVRLGHTASRKDAIGRP